MCVVVPQVIAATPFASASEVAHGLSVRVVLALLGRHASETLLTCSFVLEAYKFPVGIITLLRLMQVVIVVIVASVRCHKARPHTFRPRVVS